MSGLRGVFAGVLALVALQAVVSTDASSKRVRGLFGDAAGLVERALSPAVPAIPDRRAAAGQEDGGGQQDGGGGGLLVPPWLGPMAPFLIPGEHEHRRPKTPKPPKTAPRRAMPA